MIRKAIIVVLTLAALGTAALAGMSFLPWPSGWWEAEIAPSLRVCHVVGEWHIVFEPGSHPPLFTVLTLGAGEVTVDRSVVLTYELSPEQVPPRTRVEFGGFCYQHYVGKISQGRTSSSWVRFWKVQIPLFPMFILFAAYPTIAFIRGPLRRYRRRRKGLCPKCGYNLTGNVSGVCPECGAEVKQS